MYNLKIFLQFAKYKTLLVLIFAFPSFAQKTTDAKKIDSLLQLVKVCKVDTTKVELYHKIINVYFSTDYSKIKPYNNLILSISKINKFEKGFAHYYYNRALFNSFIGNHELARILAKKSSFFCKKLNLQANYHQSQYVYAQSLYKLDKKDDAIKIAITVLNTKYKRPYADAFAKLNYLLGCIYKDKLEFTRAIKYIDVASKLFMISKNMNGEYCCYNEKIITLMLTNQSKKAIKLSDEKVKLILKTDLASSNNVIFETLLINNAKIYTDTGDFLNAKIKI